MTIRETISGSVQWTDSWRLTQYGPVVAWVSNIYGHVNRVNVLGRKAVLAARHMRVRCGLHGTCDSSEKGNGATGHLGHRLLIHRLFYLMVQLADYKFS